MIVLGGVLSFWFLSRRASAIGLRDNDYWILVNVILGSGFVGGRLLYLLEYARPFSPEFWNALVSASSGFSVLGAFAAVPLAVWWFCRRRGTSFLRVLDTVCVMAPFWHVFGRLGCLLAGCCYGRPVRGGAWGIVFQDPRSQVPAQWLGSRLYPTQLYEALGNALIAAALYRLLLRKGEPRPGLVAAAYFCAYGVERFILEFYRGDTVGFFFGLTAGQGLGLGLIAVSAALLAGRASCTRPS